MKIATLFVAVIQGIAGAGLLLAACFLPSEASVHEQWIVAGGGIFLMGLSAIEIFIEVRD